MTMLDQATPIRPGICPAWCTTDHSSDNAASEWHSAKPSAWIAATGAVSMDTDAVAVTVDQHVAASAPSIRMDVDSIGAVAFLTPDEAALMAQRLLEAVQLLAG